MDYCAIQELLRQSHKSRNVFSTMFYCHQIDSYMEEHQIFETLGELMVRVCIERPEPENVVDYLCQQLMEISARLVNRTVKLEFYNSVEDGERLVEILSAAEDFTIIGNVNNGDNCVDEKPQRKLGIVSDYKESPEVQKLVRIIRNWREEAPQKCAGKPKNSIDIQFTEDFLKPLQLNDFVQYLRHLSPEPLIKVNWNMRVLIVGRIASGRKTQGILLAKEFGLNVISLSHLKIRYQNHDSWPKHELGFLGFIQETLLKPDCSQNGFVIVSNVISLGELAILMEKFIYRPNRIIFIHTSERECWQRFKARRNFSHSNLLFNYHMNLYDLHKKPFVEYFGRSGKVLHVNGNKTKEEIKTSLWANLVK